MPHPRHPLHMAVAVTPPDSGWGAHGRAAPGRARHRKPSALPGLLAAVPPARRLAAGLGLASVLAATVLTAALEPAAPVAPDRVPARETSSLAQENGG
ncbi:hypothetical protein DEJ50_23000 [Streptomyces venezuelae]|uniref:Uncharacterized protein n=1 Tax=Streptomyces venezuelae TaxID=54571 RepID=A0A5P2D5E3_STRVZ|nr:hypothetical protein [Streptomyces venezuelae]QES50266.1 hypothetical protein DEJ50_23000 [Streptomyces venezuelae]